jgi:hypothetical protein
VLVAVTPIDPPEGDKCWAFHVVNDSTEPIESILVERVDYEWGDFGNAAVVGTRWGPIDPFTSVEILRETDTEVRTSVRLLVRGPAGERRIIAEVGRLYRRPGPLVPIPILNLPGRLAALETLVSPPGTIEIDLHGVRRWLADGKCESARWNQLVKVEIVTTDQGPLVEDVFWVLHEPASGCVIPSEAPEARALREKLQALPNFDNEAVVSAMASTGNDRFVVWRKPPA